MVLGAAFLIGVGAFAADTTVQLGLFKDLKPHFDGTCQLVTGALGTEDLTVDPRSGVVYVSAYDRSGAERGDIRGGAIYAYDPSAATPSLVPITPSLDPRFRPHGISLWIGEDGKASLFVVNHPAPGTDSDPHTIEILDFAADGTLVPRATLRDPALLITPNDIVAVGPDRFYVTNTHAHPRGGAQTLESLMRRTQARVLYYDGAKFSPVLEPLRFPNGINVSRDGRKLYIAETTPQSLLVYDRDPASESLTLASSIPLGTSPDNIEIGESGELWIGAHPKLIEVLRAAGDPSHRAPAQVLRVSPSGQVDEVYLNDGQQISAVSTAAARGNRLFFGQITGDGILDCRQGG
jgi:arylesterase/paraoxonase